MSIPIDFAKKLENICVIEVDHNVRIDPVFLMHLDDMAKRKDPEIEEVVFIRTISTSQGNGWSYLYISDGRVKERYLYSPAVHNRFIKKKLTDSLWHGDMVPEFQEVKEQAKQYRFSEIKRT